jgi:hypothetical protein
VLRGCRPPAPSWQGLNRPSAWHAPSLPYVGRLPRCSRPKALASLERDEARVCQPRTVNRPGFVGERLV